MSLYAISTSPLYVAADQTKRSATLSALSSTKVYNYIFGATQFLEFLLLNYRSVSERLLRYNKATTANKAIIDLVIFSFLLIFKIVSILGEVAHEKRTKTPTTFFVTV
jgi:hypothetical protein